MRAVQTVAHGDRSQLVYRTDLPDPVAGPDDVIVKVAATAVNFHDIFTRRGMPGIKIPLPVIVGSDIPRRVKMSWKLTAVTATLTITSSGPATGSGWSVR